MTQQEIMTRAQQTAKDLTPMGIEAQIALHEKHLTHLALFDQEMGDLGALAREKSRQQIMDLLAINRQALMIRAQALSRHSKGVQSA